MRKVISLMHVSLDGFAAGPNGELDWAVADEEISKDVTALLRTVDTALYGRVTYHMMESYWPSMLTNPEALPHEIEHAHWIENISKIVFSQTLEGVEWKNTRLVKDHMAEEMSSLK